MSRVHSKLALVLVIAGLAQAGQDGMMDVRMGGRKDAPKKDGKDYAELIKDADVVAGLFTLYHDRDKETVWMEILPAQLDHDFILSMTQETGIGARGVLSGMPAGHDIIRFHKVGESIQVIQRNLMFRAAEGSATAPMIAPFVVSSDPWPITPPITAPAAAPTPAPLPVLFTDEQPDWPNPSAATIASATAE